MLTLLQQPYPGYSGARKGLAICAVVALCVWGVLFLLKPFGLHRLPANTLAWHALVYAGATFTIATVFTILLPCWLPKWYAEEKWNVRRELLLMLLMVITIAVANLFINSILVKGGISFKELLRFMGITLSVGILPLSIAIIFKQRSLYQKYRQAAEILNRQLKEETASAATPIIQDALQLTGDNQQERIQLLPRQLLLISTADNYVAIVHLENNQSQSVLFRGTLKKMESDLQTHPQFIRCHRSHIVNLDAVRRVTGNAQGYKLELDGWPEPIPVGRQYNPLIKERLAHLHG
jgi:hypothetical protein